MWDLSSLTGDRTCVPCIGRQILSHWTTREVPLLNSFFQNIYLFIYFWLCSVFVAAHRLYSSCGERGLLFIAVRRLLIAVASLVAKHGL